MDPKSRTVSVFLLFLSRYSTWRAEILNISLLFYSCRWYGLGFGVRDLGVRESGLDQDPYHTNTYTFTSITRVPVVQIELMRAHLKDLSARIVISSESIVTCASGLLSNLVPSFKNFIMMVKNFKNHNIMIRPKSQKFKIGKFHTDDKKSYFTFSAAR
jgi:hypothetical protein